MPEETLVRDQKLIQYLNEAFGKERELEVALEQHITMTPRASYRKRLGDHLRETKGHARRLERRIRQLGGHAELTQLPGPEAVGNGARDTPRGGTHGPLPGAAHPHAHEERRAG